jgi:hypothetical protein
MMTKAKYATSVYVTISAQASRFVSGFLEANAGNESAAKAAPPAISPKKAPIRSSSLIVRDSI